MTDVIQKKSLKDLPQTMRKLSNRGMTIILLCHTNKHKDADGNRIFEGTGDLKSDVDEFIYFDKAKQPDSSLVVTTRPDKIRADIQPLTFEINRDRKITQKDTVVDVKNINALEEQKERDAELIACIETALVHGPAIQKDVIEHCKKSGSIGEHRVRAALARYAKNSPLQRWKANKLVANNTWQYGLKEGDTLSLKLSQL